MDLNDAPCLRLADTAKLSKVYGISNIVFECLLFFLSVISSLILFPLFLMLFDGIVALGTSASPFDPVSILFCFSNMLRGP